MLHIIIIIAAAAFNQALTCIGFVADSITAINQNQITITASLIGMDKYDIEQLMKIIRGGQGASVFNVPFLAQKSLRSSAIGCIAASALVNP